MPRRGDGVGRLATIPGIGTAVAAKLARRGIRTRAQLRKIVAELPREAQANLRHNVAQAIPLSVARQIVAEIKRRLVFRTPDRRRRYPALAVGSVRRDAPSSKDIDILVVVPDDTDIQGVLASAELRVPEQRGGQRALLTLVESYASGHGAAPSSSAERPRGGGPSTTPVDLFLAKKAKSRSPSFISSSGREYNIRVRAHAKTKASNSISMGSLLPDRAAGPGL